MDPCRSADPGNPVAAAPPKRSHVQRLFVLLFLARFFCARGSTTSRVSSAAHSPADTKPR